MLTFSKFKTSPNSYQKSTTACLIIFTNVMLIKIQKTYVAIDAYCMQCCLCEKLEVSM